MQYVAPPVFALVGYYVGGPQGAAIGWTLGSALFPNVPKQPKPPGAAAQPSWNQALRGSVIPVTFGTNRVSAHVVWTKNFTPVRQPKGVSGKGGGSGGGSSKASGGANQGAYSYQADFLFHYGMTPLAISFGRMWVGGSRLTPNDLIAVGGAQMSNPPDSFSPQTFYKPQLSNGAYAQGVGSPTGGAAAWSYFTSQEGSAISFPYTVWQGFRALQEGSAPSVPQISVEIGPTTTTSYDVTPPYIIREILTNSVFGLGIPASKIVTATYSSAYTYCHSQGIYVSVTYDSAESAMSIVDDLLSLYGGYIIDSGGTLKFGYISSGDISVRTIDNSHLVVQDGKPPISVERAAPQDGYNKVRLTFSDRNLDYKMSQVEISDEVDMDLTGVRAREWSSRFVMASSLAQTLVERSLWANLYGRDTYKFTLGPKDLDIEPGDIVTLVDSSDPEISQGIAVRVVQQKQSKALFFETTAVRHQPYQVVNPRTYSAVSSISGTGSSTIEKAYSFHMYELPREFQGADAKAFVGYYSSAPLMGAQLHVSLDGSNYVQVDDKQPYNAWGLFSKPLPSDPESRYSCYPERQVDLYFFPSTPAAFNPDSPTYCQSYVPDDVTQMGRGLGLGTLFVPQGEGGEIMAMQDLTLIGQNHYKAEKLYRGWGTSSLATVNSLTRFTHHGNGTLEYALNQDTIGQMVYYKVVPYDFSGVPFDISSIDARTYQIRGEYWLPRDVTNVYLSALSPSTFANSQPLVDFNGNCGYSHVVSGGCGLKIRWPAVSRDTGYGTGGYGAGDYGSFTSDYDNVSYIVKFTQDDGPSENVTFYTIVETNAYDLSRSDWLSYVQGFNATTGIATARVRVQAINRFSRLNETATVTRGVKKKVTFVWSLGIGGGGVSAGFTPVYSAWTSPGSFSTTVPIGASFLTARVYGAGAGGSAFDDPPGGGGGSGGKSTSTYSLAVGDWGASLDFHVGSGGVGGGAGVGGALGTNGSLSDFYAVLNGSAYYFVGYGGQTGSNAVSGGYPGGAAYGQSNTTGSYGTDGDAGGFGGVGVDGYGSGGHGGNDVNDADPGNDGRVILEYS